ncbi:MAG: AAA family ATPase [Eubacterium sp.]|nr:AAA family ATPase [Eubacterium sp.]
MAKKKIEIESKLNEEQEKVFYSFKKGANIFLCGKGGSGKSFLTRYIIDYCKKSNKSVLICAPTGIAALNIGGSTVHRVFKVPARILQMGERCYEKKKLETIAKADVIIIDEISMCRIDVFEYVARTLFYMKPKKQLLFVGDFYQLPPVLPNQDGSAFSKIYGNKLFAFESEMWTKLELQTMELQTSMRQKDKAFVEALDNIRAGQPDFSLFQTDKPVDPTALTVCGTNKEADEKNQAQMKNLVKQGAKIYNFSASIDGVVEPSEYPTEREMTLCVGARIVMLNNDPDERWVNGTMATVAYVNDEILIVRIEGKEGAAVEVKRNKWTFLDYKVIKTKDGVTKLGAVERGTFEQYPVRLAWAITIHKSQGQTYDRVNVDISSIFAEGQLYVALSRCRTLAGMRIVGTLTKEKVKTSDAVLRFMSGDHHSEQDQQVFGDEESPSSDRYKEGYDDGYKDGTDDTKAEYQKMIDADKSVKRLSAYTTRQRELAEIEDPDERNPKGAGRPKKPYTEKAQSKAIRVIGSISEEVKSINDYIREHPSEEDRVKLLLGSVIEQLTKIFIFYFVLY